MAMFPATRQDLPPVLQNFTWLDCDPQRDCTLAAKCLSEELTNDDLSASTSFTLVNFARTCAPEPLTNISYEQILGWNSFLVLNQSISVLDLTDQVNQGCHREFCQTLNWEGDPDLSGPGVMAAYMIQAILTSAFSAFYVPLEIAKWDFRRRKPGKDFSLSQLPGVFPSGLLHVNRCFDVFWMTSLYFSFAIAAATYTLNLYSTDSIENTVPRYVASFSFLGTVFSWTATTALAPWPTRGGTREPRRGLYLLSAFYTIGSLAVIFSLSSYLKSFRASSPSTSPFETYCLPFLGGYESFRVFWVFTLSCMAAAWVAFAIVLIVSYVVKPIGRLMPWVNIAIRAVAFCCFILMWASLAFFLRLRLELGELSEQNKDGNLRWGFGQIVAVVGWLPMAVEILSVARDILLRRFRAWIGRDDRGHVESAVADGDSNKTASKTHEMEGNVKSNGEVKFKKVKTW